MDAIKAVFDEAVIFSRSHPYFAFSYSGCPGFIHLICLFLVVGCVIFFPSPPAKSASGAMREHAQERERSNCARASVKASDTGREGGRGQSERKREREGGMDGAE